MAEGFDRKRTHRVIEGGEGNRASNRDHSIANLVTIDKAKKKKLNIVFFGKFAPISTIREFPKCSLYCVTVVCFLEDISCAEPRK